MNEPPDQTAEFRAANLLSVGGMIVPKYCRTRSGYSRSAESVSVKITPCLARSSLQRAVDHFALVLGLHAGQELLLGLGNAQPVEGVLDVVGHVVPGACPAGRTA